MSYQTELAAAVKSALRLQGDEDVPESAVIAAAQRMSNFIAEHHHLLSEAEALRDALIEAEQALRFITNLPVLSNPDLWEPANKAAERAGRVLERVVVP